MIKIIVKGLKKCFISINEFELAIDRVNSIFTSWRIEQDKKQIETNFFKQRFYIKK